MCIIKTVKLFRLKTKRNHFKRVMRPQFSYCPLKWMFSPRKSNNLINKVRERSLRIGSSDNRNSFKSALTKCKETSIHQRNLQLLMTKLGMSNGISPPIMEKIFILRENTNNVRNFQKISNENRTTVKQGIEAISNKNPFILANLFYEYKLGT